MLQNKVKYIWKHMTPKPKNIQHICDAQIENKQYERWIYNMLKKTTKQQQQRKQRGKKNEKH